MEVQWTKQLGSPAGELRCYDYFVVLALNWILTSHFKLLQVTRETFETTALSWKTLKKS